MKSFFYWVYSIFFLVATTTVVAQPLHTLSGFITDKATGEKLIGATVYVPQLKKGTLSNPFGFYSISLATDSVRLVFSYLGHTSVTKIISFANTSRLDIALTTHKVLDAAEVVAEEVSTTHTTEMSTHQLNMQSVQALPVLLGEADVMKSLQLLPGVTSGSEGSTGLHVRGGSPDQNLILLDGVPVYNVNHLFGFLSVFNPDALHYVQLIKGGIPARYGERLSSVLNISMKEGNIKKAKGVLAMSPIVGKLTYEAPIVKNKSAFIFSGRRSWLGDIMPPENGKYNLYDINAKVNTILNSNHRVYLSMYAGRDRFSQKYDDALFGIDWGNQTFVIRWNTILSPKVFGNISTYYSQYAYTYQHKFEENNTKSLFRASSQIKEWSFNGDFDYQPATTHAIKFGFKAASLHFSPDIVTTKGISIDTAYNDIQVVGSKQLSFYIEDEIEINSQLSTNIGLRNSFFSVQDKNYWHWQPRISIRYLLGKRFSWKASYNYMVQYLHLLTNSSLGLPTDLWVSSTKKTKPETASQIASGFTYSPNKVITYTVEGYYKYMRNLIEYAEGANYKYGTSDHWEDKVVTGDGESYGMELFAKKNTGKLTGHLAYTLSWTNRWFASIDNGRAFPYKYDQRHNLTLLVNYLLTSSKKNVKNFFSLVWAFNTGNAISFPEAVYQGENLPLWIYNNNFQQREYIAKRNQFRLPNYHRLDLSFSNEKQKGNLKRTWVFSVYNAYNRLNPYFLYESKGEIRQITLFPLIPSVAYKLEF